MLMIIWKLLLSGQKINKMILKVKDMNYFHLIVPNKTFLFETYLFFLGKFISTQEYDKGKNI